MAQYQFENSAESGGSAAAFVQTSMNWLVRLAGLVLLGVGLWAAIGVINEAWAIYSAPRQSRVDAIAVAIDEATHVDSMLTPPARTDANGGDPTKPAAKAEAFRLSYFIAWPIVMLLLLLVGRLSMAAIKTGGELALFDVQFRRFARDLVREVARNQKS
jgi:hypothetical protein